MPDTPSKIRAEELAVMFEALAAAKETVHSVEGFAGDLARLFDRIRNIPTDHDLPCRPSPTYSDLTGLFSEMQPRLDAVKARGGLLNLWEIAGLRCNEVRTAGALAGLWRTSFGGSTSLDFLAFYLRRAVKDIDWHQELLDGYDIFTEVNPLGDLSDRVDLVIETARYLIGIEIKIKVGLGKNQLKRYASALAIRARYGRKLPCVVLLAPFPAANPEVSPSSWSDVSVAARQAVGCTSDTKSLVHHVIAHFGDYVAQH